MKLPKINYKLVDDAIKFYENNGFGYVEVPWEVPEYILNLTRPTSCFLSTYPSPIASGEQGFLDLAFCKQLKSGKYVTATPCFRKYDRYKSEVHFAQFYKVELINYGSNLPSDLSEMVDVAQRFHHHTKELQTIDEPRTGCITMMSCDLMFGEIEMGSYGIRIAKDKSTLLEPWIFGTGMALPRFEIMK